MPSSHPEERPRVKIPYPGPVKAPPRMTSVIDPRLAGHTGTSFFKTDTVDQNLFKQRPVKPTDNRVDHAKPTPS